MSSAPEVLKPLKTWSHLADRRKRPSEYEIVTVNLHYRNRDPNIPWELDPDIPMNKWYRKYCNESPLKHPDWDSFRDPDELIYRTYNLLQDGQEAYVRGLLDQFSDRGHDQTIAPDWLPVLARLYAPVRFPVHIVQMVSCYIGQIAPASTITSCANFQAADGLRWLTHTAYRTAELAKTHPAAGFGKNERQLWEEDPAWQGFRALMEHVLVAWDWAEAFVALNLVVKPALEECVLGVLGEQARRHNDTLYGLLSQAQMRDAERHRRWAGALIDMAQSQEGNRALIDGWIAKWQPMADRAIEAYCAALPEAGAAELVKTRVAAAQAAMVQYR